MNCFRSAPNVPGKVVDEQAVKYKIAIANSNFDALFINFIPPPYRNLVLRDELGRTSSKTF